MGWMTPLVLAIKEAIRDGRPCTIIVPSDSEQRLGQSVARHLTRHRPYDPASITFVVNPAIEYAQIDRGETS